MTQIQKQLAQTYEENGYAATHVFWSSKQEDIAKLAKDERDKLKNMMRRYCLINKDAEFASNVMQENASLQKNDIMPLLFEFGQANSLGKIIDKNEEKSEKIFSIIFEHGSYDDLFKLGQMYKSGNGARRNYEQAVKCFLKAAEAGNKPAQFMLGEMYSIGLGVERNKALAEKWYIASNAEKTPSTSSLTKMIVPDGIKIVERSAFANFESLRSVTIPAGVELIGDFAFCECKGLRRVEIFNENINIGFDAFKECDLDEESKAFLNKRINFAFVKGDKKIKDFYISKFQVTQELYEKVIGENPSVFKGVNHPVENVEYFQAVYFCNALSITENLKPCYEFKSKLAFTYDSSANGYRLPTLEEWLYVANIDNIEQDDIDEVAWNRNNSGGHTHDVGTRISNSLGVYDMFGNVWEWCYRPRRCRCGGSFKENGLYDYEFVDDDYDKGATTGFRVVRNFSSD